MSPYGSSKLMTEIMLRDTGRAHRLHYVILRYFNVAGADPKHAHRPVDAGGNASDQGRGARPRSACARRWTSSAPTIRRRTAPASATISMSAIWCARIRRRLRYLRARRRERHLQLRLWPRLLGARSDRHGQAGVRRRFPVEIGGRRPGDPAPMVADVDAHPRDARLAPAIRGSRHHRVPRLGLGADLRPSARPRRANGSAEPALTLPAFSISVLA